jgi:catechol 2,3-dioxygenase-like lactoylglutathione lyase family enzyme
MSTAVTVPHVDSGASAETVDVKFEVVVIPVVDVDRSKEFYIKLGWRVDADFPFDNGFRVCPVHAAWLRVLGSVWREDNIAPAGFGPRPLPDRLRGCGCVQRSCRTRRRGK